MFNISKLIIYCLIFIGCQCATRIEFAQGSDSQLHHTLAHSLNRSTMNSKNYNVSFGKTFSQVPKVILADKTIDTRTLGVNEHDIKIHSVTTTGFIYTASKNNSSSHIDNLFLNWMATTDPDVTIVNKHQQSFSGSSKSYQVDFGKTYTCNLNYAVFLTGSSINSPYGYQISVSQITQSNATVYVELEGGKSLSWISFALIVSCDTYSESGYVGKRYFNSSVQNGSSSDSTDHTVSDVEIFNNSVIFDGISAVWVPDRDIRFGTSLSIKSDSVLSQTTGVWASSRATGGYNSHFMIQICDKGQAYTGTDCVDCKSSCSTCKTNRETCLQCQGNNRDNVLPSCKCNTGYYDEGTLIDCLLCVEGRIIQNDNCNKCDIQCGTCQSTPDNCIITCNNNCGDQGCDITGICLNCADGFYLEDNTCKQCNHSKCGTCSDLDTCISPCNSDCLTCLPDSTCDSCEIKFFLSNGTCLDCHSECSECTSLSNCSSCIDGTFLSGTSCLNCDNLVCATCQTTDSTCILSCNENCGDQGCNVQGICLNCADGFYLEDNTCKQCNHSKCGTCSDLDTCIAPCNSDCLTCLPDSTCDSCEIKFFLSNGTCLDCPSECSECTSLSNCSSCIDGTFLSGTSCLNCDNLVCATCQTTDSTCILSCNQNCGDQGCNLQGICLNCADGFYLEDNTCKQCNHSKCGTCSDLDTCISPCNSDCLTCLPDSTCDSCEIKFFLSNGTCLDCPSECSECTALSNCSSCIDGTFLSGTSCLNCDNLVCATCQTTNSTCILSCNENCGDQGCNLQGICLNCADGFYLEDNTCKQCNHSKCGTCSDLDTCIAPCNSDCLTCLPDSTCDSCYLGFFLDLGQCQECTNDNCKYCSDANTCTECMFGYYLDNYICKECSNDCLTCESQSTYCLSCLKGTYLSNNQCFNCDNTVCGTCQNNEKECIQKCDSSCNTCDVYGKCIDCLGDMILNQNTKLCECQVGYFEQNSQCILCDEQCKSCEQNASNCLECQNQNMIYRMPEPSCQCLPGYTEDELGICSECNSNNSAACVQFFETLLQSNNLESIIPACNEACSECDVIKKGCKTCSGNFIVENDECICPKPLYLINNQCVDKCKENEFMDYKEVQCKPCYYFQDLCLQECPEQTIFDESDQKCYSIDQNNTSIIVTVGATGLVLVILAVIYTLKQKNNLQQYNNVLDNRSEYDNISKLSSEQKIDQLQESEQQTNILDIKEEKSIQSDNLLKDSNMQQSQQKSLVSQNILDKDSQEQKIVEDEQKMNNNKQENLEINKNENIDQDKDQNQDQEIPKPKQIKRKRKKKTIKVDI